MIDDSWPMPYFVTSPCNNVSKGDTNCTSFNSEDSAGAPAYAASQQSKTSSVCYALGHLADLQSVRPIVSENNATGIEIEYPRSLRLRGIPASCLCGTAWAEEFGTGIQMIFGLWINNAGYESRSEIEVQDCFSGGGFVGASRTP